MDNAQMDYISNYLDLIFHVDQVLDAWIHTNDTLTYALVFLILFIETGLVFMPFLPGDSLLFMMGAFCSTGLLSTPTALAVCLTAAILGDQVNYTIGKYLGKQLIHPPYSKWIKQEALFQSEQFFLKWGALAIILARFLPFIRTFAPFLAGVSQMNRLLFSTFNALGAMIWILSVGLMGYLLGEIPWVKAHIQSLVLALIIGPGLLAIWGTLRQRARAQS
jgi:membrane-associated protein